MALKSLGRPVASRIDSLEQAIKALSELIISNQRENASHLHDQLAVVRDEFRQEFGRLDGKFELLSRAPKPYEREKQFHRAAGYNSVSGIRFK